MKRRGWTVLVGAVLVALMTWQTLSMHVAYVALGPGPTYDTLGEYKDGKDKVQLITADDKASSDSKGELRLVTIRIYEDVSLAKALYFWMSDDYAVMPRELQFPEDKSDAEIDAEQKEMWETSQKSAETAALRVLGEPVRLTVDSVEKDSDAQGELEPDDVVTTAAGKKVTSQQKLKSVLSDAVADNPGEPVKLKVKRDNKDETVEVVPEKTTGGTVGVPGVKFKPVQKDPYDLKITTEGLDIGGPSAGLMFALALIDRVSDDDLTSGKHIAGTGEIDEEGTVGPIGGVAQKVVAARQEGASIFLTPADNCAAAKQNAPDGLSLVRVENLAGALDALRTLREGGQPPTCLTGSSGG